MLRGLRLTCVSPPRRNEVSGELRLSNIQESLSKLHGSWTSSHPCASRSPSGSLLWLASPHCKCSRTLSYNNDTTNPGRALSIGNTCFTGLVALSCRRECSLLRKTHMLFYLYIYTYLYIYIHILSIYKKININIYMYIYICLYIYIDNDLFQSYRSIPY